jgi:RNA binding exosome subunit
MSEEKFSYFVSYLKDSFDQAVVWHHQTDSYAVHKALNKFYDGILDLTDGLVESVSGIHGRPMKYQIDSPVDYKNPEQVVKYFKSAYELIEKERKDIYQESWIQNQVDEISALFASTLYLLSLK